MNTQQLKELRDDCSRTLGMMAGSTHPRTGKMVMAEAEMLRLLSFVHRVPELIDHLEAAERERDELNNRLTLVREQRDAELNKNTQLESEFARRDAAAVEPVSEIKWDGTDLTVQNVRDGFSYGVTKVYTAAPPAKVPDIEQDVKNITDLLSEREWGEHCTTTDLGRKLENEITELHNIYNQKSDVQPEKVVELPIDRKVDDIAYGGSGAFGMGKTSGFNEGLNFFRAALDAAGVKWVQK